MLTHQLLVSSAPTLQVQKFPPKVKYLPISQLMVTFAWKNMILPYYNIARWWSLRCSFMSTYLASVIYHMLSFPFSHSFNFKGMICLFVCKLWGLKDWNQLLVDVLHSTKLCQGKILYVPSQHGKWSESDLQWMKATYQKYENFTLMEI